MDSTWPYPPHKFNQPIMGPTYVSNLAYNESRRQPFLSW